MELDELRCSECGKKLGENLSGSVEIVCPRCRHYNKFEVSYVTYSSGEITAFNFSNMLDKVEFWDDSQYNA